MSAYLTKPGYTPVVWTAVEHQDGTGQPGLFDAVFYRDVSSPGYYTLTLQLRISVDWYHALPPFHVDANNNKGFMVRQWTGAEKDRFVRDAKAQANLWNNRFWLKVPPAFDALNYVSFVDGKTYQPQYVKCELDVDFTATKDTAHQTLRVVNLERSVLPANANASTFRSAATLFDSLDGTPTVSVMLDHTGNPYNAPKVTIAHELGHKLGLGHIGVLRGLPLCEVAMALDKQGLGSGSFYRGGRNARVCYGHLSTPDHGTNIMGGGDQFAIENARPWVFAARKMSQNLYEVWEVLTRNPRVNALRLYEPTRR